MSIRCDECGRFARRVNPIWDLTKVPNVISRYACERCNPEQYKKDGDCYGPGCRNSAITEFFCGPYCYERWQRNTNVTSDSHERPEHGVNIDGYIQSTYRSYEEWRRAQSGAEREDTEDDCE